MRLLMGEGGVSQMIAIFYLFVFLIPYGNVSMVLSCKKSLRSLEADRTEESPVRTTERTTRDPERHH